ncbi:unnamed protein product [Diatraea saccharalis]|uniref:Kynureninase n=1 Tax=Diatraea saccharalis TaxID=40085 RepID=A0A9N9R5U5_9NEOP|nr:unnamed protein product [Diatraea saccharalis]
MEKHFEDGVEYPKKMDNNDKLGHFRHRFYLTKGVINLCGNSLGLASKDAEESAMVMMEHWKEYGIRIWGLEGSKYYLYSEYLAGLMAPIVGAEKDEIAVIGNTTTTIHQAISTLYKPTKEKYKILVDDINFPTDRYAVDGQVRLKGYDPKDAVKVVPAVDGKFFDEDMFIEAMTDDVALILLPAVYYRTAQVVDMKKVTEAAKKRNIIIGWDLCHAVGAIEIDLNSLDPDFAVWCTYKYLNGGPGSPGAIYCNKRHFKTLPGLTGWFGSKNETQFLLRQEFDHKQDASGWQIGTPGLLSMATIEGALKIILQAGMGNMRKKSLHITAYFMYLIEKKLSSYGFTIGNLRDDSKRGGHICLEHDEGYRISLALIARGVIGDFRDPNVIRLTPTALYTSYMEVYQTIDILLDIVKTESYKEFQVRRNLVV